MIDDDLSITTPATFLSAATGLGRVRVVVRNCSGLAEVFCSTDAFILTAQWLTVEVAGAHLHVELTSLARAVIREPGDDAHPSRGSVWLHGRCDSPCLLLVMDERDAVERERQEAALAALRARFGAEVAFRPLSATGAARSLALH